MSNNKPQIQTLTPAQKALVPQYYETFKQIGISTTPCDRAKAEKALVELQHYLKLPTPRILWAENPYEAAIMAAMVKKGSKNITQAELNEQASAMSHGSFSAYWVSTYSFIARELDVERDNLIELVEDVINNTGSYFTFEGLIIVSEKPSSIIMTDDAQPVLHNENGPALSYNGGFNIYCLNGQRMPDWLFTTPKDQINPADVLSIENVEVRLEAIKWFGMQHFREALNVKVLDASNCSNEYELWEMKLKIRGNTIKAKALRMKNPSEDKIHVEGVEDSCKTVEDALLSRIPKHLRDKYGTKLAGARA